jgi:DUF971 family protein
MHEPIQFHSQGPGSDSGENSGDGSGGNSGGDSGGDWGGRNPGGDPGGDPGDIGTPAVRPKHMDLKKDTALTIHWSDGRVSIYPIVYLRKLSPSAEAKELREEMARNPLTVLPASAGQGGGTGPLTAEGIERVGNYAIRLRFSDGHDTGIYSWRYLRQIDPNRPLPSSDPGG